MSNVTLNELSISDFMNTKQIHQSPLKLVVNDVLRLSDSEIDLLVSMIESVKDLDINSQKTISVSIDNILKRRPNKEQDKDH